MSIDLTGAPFPPPQPDDRIVCTYCARLAPNGRCIAAARRERTDVGPEYGHPIDIPHRCVFFAARRDAADRRSGRERFPALASEYDAMVAARDSGARATARRGMERAKAALGRGPPIEAA